MRKILQDDHLKNECGLGNAHFYSSKELARGQARDKAIELHLKMIEQHIMVNLYFLELHELKNTISPELRTHLLNSTHKKSQ